MLFSTPAFLLFLATTTTTTLASPVPAAAAFDDIERRWASGQNEVCLRANLPGCYVAAWMRSWTTLTRGSHVPAPLQQEIHAGLSHRDMTPAWPIARDAKGAGAGAGARMFASATDERSIAVAERRDVASPAEMMDRMRDFALNLLRSKGVPVEEDEVPVVRPRKEMSYYFTA